MACNAGGPRDIKRGHKLNSESEGNFVKREEKCKDSTIDYDESEVEDHSEEDAACNPFSLSSTSLSY